MLFQVRDARQLVSIFPRTEGETQGGARNIELEELRRRIEELENIRLGDVETDLESEDELEQERNVEEVDLVVQLIYFLKDKGSERVEV
jgi:hypothetical protein